MKNTITVLEFDKITVNTFVDFGINERLAKNAFNELEKFVLPLTDSDDSDEINFEEFGELKNASACMSVASENGKKVIRVKNYVGTITLRCGVTIEVLPKITTARANANGLKTARKLIIEMLKSCSDIFYKSFFNANLSVENLNLFEVYVLLFLNELDKLYKKGLRAGYVTVNDNENSLKGKLLFGEHIKRNICHKEKFYVEYHEFNFNRAENRLVKTAIAYLLRKSQFEGNLKRLRQYLLLFDDIAVSDNVEADFAKCESGRSVRDYCQIIKLCRVFLRKKSFTMYSGDKNVVALMFPMEVLFERYIAKEINKHIINSDWKLHAQQQGHYLFDEKLFSLRPDIILKNSKIGKIVILDTKWKCLKNDVKINYGISQADMYQMYAYHTRIPDVQEVVLLYPYYYEASNLNNLQYTISNPTVNIYIAFFNIKEYIETHKFTKCIYGLKSNSNLWGLLSYN